MKQQDIYIALDWLKPSLDETCDEAIEVLSDLEEITQLNKVADLLHQISGTLILTELTEFQILSETMENFCHYIISDKKPLSLAIDLLQALTVFKFEIEELHIAKKKHTGLLKQRANFLRSLMGLTALNDSSIDKFVSYEKIIPDVLRGDTVLTPENFETLYQAWRKHTLGFIDASDEALASLIKISHYLRQGADQQSKKALWHVACEWLASLRENQVQPSNAIIHLLMQLNDFIVGEVDASQVDMLIADIIINCIALQQKTDNVIDLIELFSPLSNQNKSSRILDSVSVSLLNAMESFNEDVKGLSTELLEIKWLLEVGGWQLYQQFTQSIVDEIKAFSVDTLTEDNKWKIQRGLTELHHAINNTKKLLGNSASFSEGVIEDAKSAVLREIRIELEKVKSNFNGYCLSRSFDDLKQIPVFLNASQGAFRVLDINEAASFMSRLANLFIRVLNADIHVLSWHEIDAIAESISGLEYYFDLLAQNYTDNTVLVNAEKSLTQAEELLNKNIITPHQKDDVSDRLKVISDDTTYYDDRSEVSDSDIEADVAAFVEKNKVKPLDLPLIDELPSIDDEISSLEQDVERTDVLEQTDIEQTDIEQTDIEQADVTEEQTSEPVDKGDDLFTFDEQNKTEQAQQKDAQDVIQENAKQENATQDENVDEEDIFAFDDVPDIQADTQTANQQQASLQSDVHSKDESAQVTDDPFDFLDFSIDENANTENAQNIATDDIQATDVIEEHSVESEDVQIEPSLEQSDISANASESLETQVTNEAQTINDAQATENSNMVDLVSLNNAPYPLDELKAFTETDEIRKANLLINDDDFSQDEEIREIFIEEADEVLEHIGKYLPMWKDTPTDFASLTEVRRSFHTLKGSGRMVGANQAGEVAWSIENMLNRVIDNTIPPTLAIIELVEKAVALFPTYISDFENLRATKFAPVVTIVQANNLIANKPMNEGLPATSDAVNSPIDANQFVGFSTNLPNVSDTQILEKPDVEFDDLSVFDAIDIDTQDAQVESEPVTELETSNLEPNLETAVESPVIPESDVAEKTDITESPDTVEKQDISEIDDVNFADDGFFELGEETATEATHQAEMAGVENDESQSADQNDGSTLFDFSVPESANEPAVSTEISTDVDIIDDISTEDDLFDFEESELVFNEQTNNEQISNKQTSNELVSNEESNEQLSTEILDKPIDTILAESVEANLSETLDIDDEGVFDFSVPESANEQIKSTTETELDTESDADITAEDDLFDFEESELVINDEQVISEANEKTDNEQITEPAIEISETSDIETNPSDIVDFESEPDGLFDFSMPESANEQTVSETESKDLIESKDLVTSMDDDLFYFEEAQRDSDQKSNDVTESVQANIVEQENTEEIPEMTPAEVAEVRDIFAQFDDYINQTDGNEINEVNEQSDVVTDDLAHVFDDNKHATDEGELDDFSNNDFTIEQPVAVTPETSQYVSQPVNGLIAENQPNGKLEPQDNVDDTEAKSESNTPVISDKLADWIEQIEMPEDDTSVSDSDIKEIFLEEVEEVLDHIYRKLPLWQENIEDKNAIADIRRGFHTLKGSGRMVGANRIGEFAWQIENMLNRIIDNSILANRDVVALVAAATDTVPRLLLELDTNKHRANILPLMASAQSYTKKNEGVGAQEAIALLQFDLITDDDSSAEAPATETPAKLPEIESIETEDLADLQTQDSQKQGVEAQSEIQPETFESVTDVQTQSGEIDSDETKPDKAKPETQSDAGNLIEEETAFDTPIHNASVDLTDAETKDLDDNIETGIEADADIDETFLEDFNFENDALQKDVLNTQVLQAYNEIVQPVTNTNTEMDDDLFSFDTDLPSTDVPSTDVPSADVQNPAQDTDTSKDLKAVFLEEAQDLVTAIDYFIENNPNGGEISDDLIRALHTLRGSAAMSGIEPLHDLNQAMENVCRHFMDNQIDFSTNHIGLLKALLDRSIYHISLYADNDTTEDTATDESLIADINSLIELNENQDNAKIQVAQLVALDIDLVLDAEWELETHIFNDTNYVSEMLKQLSRLQNEIEHVSKLNDVVVYLQFYYQILQEKPALNRYDRLIDGLLLGHKEITNMFDALAASQRINCDDETLAQFEALKVWLIDMSEDMDSLQKVEPEALQKTDVLADIVDTNVDDTINEHSDEFASLNEIDSVFSDNFVQENSVQEASVQEDSVQKDNKASVPDSPVESSVESPAIETDSEALVSESLEDTEQDDIEEDLLPIFLEESQEIVENIDESFNEWQDQPDNLNALASLQRHLHTIKGGARMIRANKIGDLTHEAETVYEMLTSERLVASDIIVKFMRHIQDVIVNQVDQLAVDYKTVTPAKKELQAISQFVENVDEDILFDFFGDSTSANQPVITETQNESQPEQNQPAESAEKPSTEKSSTEKPSESTEPVRAPVKDVSGISNRIDLLSVPALIIANVTAEEWQDDVPDEDMLEIFIEEAEEIVDESSALFHEWCQDVTKLETLQALQRQLHTLKGGARMSGVQVVGDLSHEMEFLYEDFALEKKEPKASIVKVLSQSHDWLAEAVQVLKSGKNPGSADVLIKPFQAFMRDPDGFRMSQFANADAATQINKKIERLQTETTPTTAKISDTEKNIIKPPVYETSQQVEGMALSDLVEKSADNVNNADVDMDKVAIDIPDMNGEFSSEEGEKSSNEMIRISSALMEKLINLSGEAVINRGRVEVGNSNLTQTIEEMGSTVQRLADQLRRMEIELEEQILAQYESEMTQHDGFDPLEMDQYSALNQLSKSLSESASDLLDIKATMLDKTRESDALLLQLSRIQTELQEGLMNSRLVPFSRLAPRLQRVIRQTANELKKSVDLEIINANAEVDRTVLERITSPLEHMLRNAVDHGIEMPDERTKKGKDPKGKIQLSLKREGGEIFVTVTDNGKGIDVDAVRKKATERGLIHNQSMSDIDVMQFIFNAGLSTKKQVTQISGRGVGMDVVQSEIKQLGGSVAVRSEVNKGSTFEMHLPLTVAVADALIVRVGDRHYAIPLVQIERIERLSFERIKEYYQSDEETIDIENKAYRLRYLNNLLQGSALSEIGAQVSTSIPVIIVKTAAGQKQAIHVDELSGSRTEIVIKPLGTQLAQAQGISAATILGDGSVMLILDLLALLRNAPAEKRLIVETKAEEATKDETHVMVVDDSVTVRKVTTRLLERNGFVVHTAKDGMDAMEKLQEITPDIMLLDIEMPRMDGFEVATLVRKDTRLCNLPIIMITSRTGEKHRERAFETGVNCYMGKPFQEKELLENLEELLNQTELDAR